MSDIGKTALKNKIDAKIYDNESQLITGAILNEVLQDAVDTLADGGNLDAGSVDTANLNDEAVTKGKLEQNVSADLDWAVASNSYYRNSQAGDVAAKVITTYKNMNLIGGGSLKVTFEQANTADDATLNIDGKGAKPLYYNGKRVSSTNSWEANETVEIYYNNYNSGAYYAKRWMVEPVSVSQNTETGKEELKIGDTPALIVDNEPTAGSNNLVKSGGVANAMIQIEGNVGAKTTTRIVTSADYVNLIWDGNKVALSSNLYNGIIIPIHKDVEYSDTGTILTALLFDHYPQINDTTYIESWGQLFTDKKSESDGFLLITFATANSMSITTNTFGLIKNVSENTLDLKTLNLTVGQGYIKTITSSDYVNLLWDGTKVIAASAYNKAFVVKIDKGFSYTNTGSILSAILFDHYPKVNDTSYIESWGQTINNKFANYEGYLLVSFNTTNTEVFERIKGGICKNLDTLNLLYDKVNVSEYNFVTTDNTRLSKFISLSEGTYVVRLVQKSGKLKNYNLYITDNPNGNNPIIIKQSIIFDNFVDVSIPNGYKYIWLFNASDNLPAGDYTCYIYNNDSYSELLDKNLSVSLYGKRMVCLGDSVTAFPDSSNKQYSDYINYFAGSYAVSGGIGGTRAVPRATVVGIPQTLVEAWATLDLENLVSAWVSDSWDNVDAASEIVHNSGGAGQNQDKDILNLKNTPIESVNIVTIMIGTNDYTGNVQISDIKTSLKNSINAIMAANKKVEIYLFTPTVRYVNANSPEERTDADWCDNWQNTNGDTLSDICDAIIDVSKECHIPCIDIYHNLGWNQSNFSNYFNDNDSTHPYKGFNILGKKIFKYLKSH